MTRKQPFESTTGFNSEESESRDLSPNGKDHSREDESSSSTRAVPGQLGHAVASQAQAQVGKLTREARRQATTNLERQTRRAALIVGALGTALHSASNQLRAQDEPMAANYYDLAGDRVDHLASTIERQDPDHLLTTAQRFAQRQPILFFGTAAVLGVIGVRALRSSSSHDQESAGYSLRA